MKTKVQIALVLALLLSLGAGIVLADEPRGSIRGTVYQDLNGDGKCVNTGEPILAGIPIQFVSNDGKTSLFLQSGSNGTYGLVAAGLGTWSVSAKPSADWVVTSKNPLEAFLGTNQLLVLGVDFCLAKAGTAIVVLPDSGALLAPVLVLATALGSMFVVAGAGLEIKRRRSQ